MAFGGSFYFIVNLAHIAVCGDVWCEQSVCLWHSDCISQDVTRASGKASEVTEALWQTWINRENLVNCNIIFTCVFAFHLFAHFPRDYLRRPSKSWVIYIDYHEL